MRRGRLLGAMADLMETVLGRALQHVSKPPYDAALFNHAPAFNRRDVMDQMGFDPAQQLAPQQTLYLPEASLDAFLAGEAQSGDCSIRLVKEEKGTWVPKTKNSQPPSNAIHWTRHYACSHGGADQRLAADAPAPAPRDASSKQRLGSVGRGESIKVGCLYSITITKPLVGQYGPGWLAVRFGQAKHVDATGAPCHGRYCSTCPAPLAAAPRLSDECRRFTTELLRRVPEMPVAAVQRGEPQVLQAWS